MHLAWSCQSCHRKSSLANDLFFSLLSAKCTSGHNCPHLFLVIAKHINFFFSRIIIMAWQSVYCRLKINFFVSFGSNGEQHKTVDMIKCWICFFQEVGRNASLHQLCIQHLGDIIFCTSSNKFSKMLWTGASLSLVLHWSFDVKSSKCRQYARNRKRLLLIAAMLIGIPVLFWPKYMSHSLCHFFSHPKTAKFLEECGCLFHLYCTASGLINFSHIFSFWLVQVTISVIIASSKKSWNVFSGVSASKPLPFGPKTSVIIFCLAVLLAFLGVVCHRYRYLPRTSSSASFSPSDSKSLLSVLIMQSDGASSSGSLSHFHTNALHFQCHLLLHSLFLLPTLPKFPKLVKLGFFAVSGHWLLF